MSEQKRACARVECSDHDGCPCGRRDNCNRYEPLTASVQVLRTELRSKERYLRLLENNPSNLETTIANIKEEIAEIEKAIEVIEKSVSEARA